MISSLERRIIIESLIERYNAGDDITAILKSYTKLTFSEREEIYTEITGQKIPYTLKEIKEVKLIEFAEACSKAIENGTDVDIDGNTEHFSYKLATGDQTNIDNLMVSARTTGMPQPYHADGKDCKMYSVEQIFNIYMALMANKTNQTTYYNQLKQYILNEFTTEDDVKFVEKIKYGDQLVGKYYDTYVEILKQSTSIMNQFIAKYTAELAASKTVTNLGVDINRNNPITNEDSITRQN